MRFSLSVVFATLFFVCCVSAVPATLIHASTYRPVVIWHGMGDNCCLPFSMGAIKKEIEAAAPGIYVKSLMIGSNPAADSKNSYFMPINKQIEMACEQLSQDPLLKDGFNAIGFSQGSQFLRAYVQRCNSPPVHNLLSVGGQHQGVFGMPNCMGANSTLCEEMRRLLNIGAYVPAVQKHLVQAEYWHDSLHPKDYITKNIFLPEINNEVIINTTYVSRLQSLNKFVMVKFTEDMMVQPRESEWFGFYKDGSDKDLQTLQESALYTEDRLGLKQMDTDGKLVFLSCVGDHLQMPKGWFETNLIPYLTDAI